MIDPKKDPRRKCRKVEEWPAADRLAWESALQRGDILDDDAGPASHWANATVHKNRRGYGRWLTFLDVKGRLDETAPPASRITLENVAAYLDELSGMVSSWTLRNRIDELLAVARVITPATDLVWLKRIRRRLEARAIDARDKAPRMRSAAEISSWAHQELKTVCAVIDTGMPDAIRFRDALMIALLIGCPTLRRRNLSGINVGQQLRRRSNGFDLCFAASETKTHKPIEIPVPEDLVAYLSDYLKRFRPLLLGEGESDTLWVSSTGRAMTEMYVYHRIIKVTKRAFGVAINPHLFRDCAVTTVAIEDPEHIGIAAPILGHSSLKTTERYYIQAASLVASRRLGESIRTLRSTLPPPRPEGKGRRNRSRGNI